VVISQGSGTDLTATSAPSRDRRQHPNAFFPANFAFQYTNPTTGLAAVNMSSDAVASSAPAITGHVDPRQIMDVGVMNGNIPAPLMAIDEDDEFFLTLTNVGMIMRPDLFEQQRSTSTAIQRLGVLRRGAGRLGRDQHRRQLHLLLPGAGRGNVLLDCHITPPEHLQMGDGGAAVRAAAAETG